MKLSVLISFYNASPFIEGIVRSIAKQEFDDIELLFADDGSTDGSSQILQAALARHLLLDSSRIFRHTHNRGLSVRRQELFEAAGGKYALCLDVDDEIEPGMFKGLVQTAEEHDADLVWENLREDYRHHSIQRSQRCPETPDHLITAILEGTVGAYLWNKLIRLGFLRQAGVRFSPGLAGCEDILFICELLVHQPRVAYLDACHYHYRQYAGSLIHRPISDHLQSYQTAAAQLDPILRTSPELHAALRRWKARIRFDATLDRHLSDTRLSTFLPEAANDGIWKPGLAKRICRGLASHHLRFIPCLAKSAYMGIKSLALLRRPTETTRYQLVDRLGEDFNATTKAPEDIDAIADGLGFKRISLVRVSERSSPARLASQVVRLIQALLLPFRVKRHAILLFQFPRTDASSRLGFLLLWLLQRFRQVRLITLIHDLNSMREVVSGENARWLVRERRLLARSDALIVHNRRMADWLRERGVREDRLLVLEIFDYLSTAPIRTTPTVFSKSVTIAGNLDTSTKKSRYLQELSTIPVGWELYGPGFDPRSVSGTNVRYNGCLPPNDLPERLSSGFGLVWDGESVETCSGAFGEYLRLNNPHKLSLYLSSGLPVIIWEEAAEAEFVLRNEVGIAVRSLRELPEALSAITEQRYAHYAENALRIARQLRTGEFTRRALESALADIIARATTRPSRHQP